MGVINDLQLYAIIILCTVIAIGIAGGALVFYFLKVKKVSAEEEIINYDNFVRTDAREYCKFDDIFSGRSGMGMIHLGNNTYVSGIEVQGYNFTAASADEKQRTMMNAIAFFNILEQPIQMCQTVKAIDISKNIEEVHGDAEEIEKRLLSVQEELNVAIENLKAFNQMGNDDYYIAEEKRVKKLINTIQSLKWQIDESKMLISEMSRVSDTNFNTMRSNQIIFSYTYSPDDDIERLSDEEIVIKAEQELRNQAGIYGSALESCGCTWKILKAEELVNLIRRHLHPVTCDEIPLDKLLNSTYNSLFVTTDSFEELERERRGDLEYEEIMREYAEQLAEKERLAQESFDNTIVQLEEDREKVV